MQHALITADTAQKTDLMKRFGIDPEVANATISTDSSHDIEIRPLRTHSGKPNGLVFLPCGVSSQAFLYLLDKTGPKFWHVNDSVSLDCFNEPPTYHLLSLAPGEDAILVQHINAGHGSG